MKNLINEDGSINPHEWFTFLDGNNKDKKLKVVATDYGNGYKVWDAIDRIINLDTNKKTELKRSSFKSLNPKIL